MAHPEIVNATPFAFEPIFSTDEDLRPVVVTLVKGTFSVDHDGAVELADEQLPVKLAGERWRDDPPSTYKFEPEIALCKVATDVVLVGHAWPPNASATQVDVGIKVGPVQKLARVFGDRSWILTKQGIVKTSTAPLDRVPLMWERSFGGRDAARSTATSEVVEARNPVGVGFGSSLAYEGDRLPLPNIEDPNALIERYGVSVAPCGFGFVSPDWHPRATFAGTYDDGWNRSRKPMLPADFDRRFFNAAPPGLIAPGHLRGDEDVVVLNAADVARLAFKLPGAPPPHCRVVLRSGLERHLDTALDTVIVDTDARRVMLLWRAYTTIGNGPNDVSAIEVGVPN